MKSAIRLSVFPYQKGAYYCTLAEIYLIKKDYKNIESSYAKAFNYLNGYDFSCWGIAFLHYKNTEQYDTAIKAVKGFYKANRNNATINQNGINSTLSTLYMMKQDYQQALKYANLSIKNETHMYHRTNYNPLPKEYAKRGFIYKQLKQENLAKKDYEKAISLCKNAIEKKKVNDSYYNFRNIELQRELKYQKKVKNS